MRNVISETTIETVKATIPFLEGNGVKLTEHFYKRLFKGNPEVKEFFNASNQSDGVQQRALGGAILAFAKNIETPEMLTEAVRRIGNKHASLGIKPEHYPIVGEHLLGSIDDLLDPAPTEILEAWGEAYGFLTNVLTEAEKEIYENQQKQEGGWNGFREMEIIKREKESDTIASFYLKPQKGTLPKFKPGQYITIRVPDGQGSTTMRNYSLSGSPEWDHFRISVKREKSQSSGAPDGFVSTYLHEKKEVGCVVEMAPPCGDFYLEKEAGKEILLIAGGVGVTPLISMLHKATDCKMTFIHCSINGQLHGFRNEVEEIAKRKEVNVHYRYSSPSERDVLERNFHSEGLVEKNFIEQFVNPETEIYFCGPKPLMVIVSQTLSAIGHDPAKIHYEFFGPQEDLKN